MEQMWRGASSHSPSLSSPNTHPTQTHTMDSRLKQRDVARAAHSSVTAGQPLQQRLTPRHLSPLRACVCCTRPPFPSMGSHSRSTPSMDTLPLPLVPPSKTPPSALTSPETHQRQRPPLGLPSPLHGRPWYPTPPHTTRSHTTVPLHHGSVCPRNWTYHQGWRWTPSLDAR